MPRVKLFNQEEVLQKAMNVFWEKGFHATSMQDLVSTLGISRGSLYDTYGGKQELFDLSLTNYKEGNLIWLRNFLHAEKDVKKGIRKMLNNIVNSGINDPNFKSCFVVKTSSSLTSNDKALAKELAEYHVEVRDVIVAYLKSGDLNSDRDLVALADLMMTMNAGLSIVVKINPQKESLSKSIDEIMRILD